MSNGWNETYYPPAAFAFDVQLLGGGTASTTAGGADASFQEVSGITAELLTEEVAEGGENRFAHQLPQRNKYSNLILKRGVVTANSVLSNWTRETLESGLAIPIMPQNILVTLMDQTQAPLMSWSFNNAFPVKWDVADLNSMDNKILIETLEFSYSYFTQKNS